MNAPSDKNPWYKEGLKFKCTGCGKCCTGTPGYTFLSEEEVLDIATFLKMNVKLFAHKYLRRVGSRLALLEKGPSYDCIFLKDNLCEIYQNRPLQCRTYPFWPYLLQSKEEWESEKERCEGINDEAPFISFEQIEKTKEEQKNYENKLVVVKEGTSIK